MGEHGYATNTKGRRTVDTTPTDAVVEGLGFNPTTVADETRKTMPVYQDIALQKKTQAAIVDAWANGIVNNDSDAVDAAQKRLERWNRLNPDTQIVISGATVKSRVKQLMSSKDDRLLRLAPKPLRGRVAGGLSDVGE